MCVCVCVCLEEGKPFFITPPPAEDAPCINLLYK